MAKKPRILLFDIETFPNLGYCWGKWDQSIIKFKKHWEMAAFAYKWLDGKSIKCVSRRTHSEKELLEELRDLLNKTDIAIAHNGDQFDIKKARAKFVQHKLKPYALNKTVDTKKVAKSQFGFVSNSLNDLADFLGLGRKHQTGGADLWFDCMDGLPKAWDKMERYNKQDVVLLERVYLRLRPWMTAHPNVAALQDKVGCSACGSENIHFRGYTPTSEGKRKRFVCLDCNKWGTAALKKSKGKK